MQVSAPFCAVDKYIFLNITAKCKAVPSTLYKLTRLPFVFLSSLGTMMIRVMHCWLFELIKEIKEENNGKQRQDTYFGKQLKRTDSLISSKLVSNLQHCLLQLRTIPHETILANGKYFKEPNVTLACRCLWYKRCKLRGFFWKSAFLFCCSRLTSL